MQNKEKIFTVLVGGVAGAGARSAGSNFGRLLNQCGYNVFVSVEYPSLIRGGHNICRLSFSAGEITNDYRSLDVLVALDQKTVDLHQKEMTKDGMIFFDGEGKNTKKVFNIPATIVSRELSAPLIMQATPLLGSLCYRFKLDFKKLESVFKEIFGVKASLNIELAKKGYAFAQEQKMSQIDLSKPIRKNKKVLLDGSVALSDGMIKAGLQTYVAYPMTPATPMLHYMAKNNQKLKIKTIQVENEIAVANMALGLSFAGNRSAVGTSGGGFALMMEAMSLSGIAELPIVAINAQRMGPATGIATQQAQGDLSFTKNIPGEYPRIVLAPGDAEESYEIGGLAMNLAWKYQLPVLILTDKHLAESAMSSDLSKIRIKKELVKLSKGGMNYERYKITPDGISPLAFPGAKDTVVKVDSYEHTEDGVTTEDSVVAVEMYDKRFAKLKGIKNDQKKLATVKIYGDKKSKNAVIFWGSTKGSVLEAMKHTKNKFRAVQIVWLNPIDEIKLNKILSGVKKIVAVEGNYTGQMCLALREQIGLDIKKKILKYDALPFEPCDLAREIDGRLSS